MYIIITDVYISFDTNIPLISRRGKYEPRASCIAEFSSLQIAEYSTPEEERVFYKGSNYVNCAGNTTIKTIIYCKH